MRIGIESMNRNRTSIRARAMVRVRARIRLRNLGDEGPSQYNHD